MLKNSNYSDKSYLNFPPADPEKIFSILKKAKIKDNKQYQGKVLLILILMRIYGHKLINILKKNKKNLRMTYI